MKQKYPKLVQYISRQMLLLYTKINKFISISLHHISPIKTSLNEMTKLNPYIKPSEAPQRNAKIKL